MPVIFLCYNFEVCSMCNYESEVAQSCLTLCNPVDCILPGSSIHGILQARILEWVPFPSSGNLPDQGIKPRSPALQADALPSEPPYILSLFRDIGSLYLLVFSR